MSGSSFGSGSVQRRVFFPQILRDRLTGFDQAGLGDQTAAAAMTQAMIGQSYLLSSLDLFYISGWLCLALIPLCFLVRRPAPSGATVVAAD